MPLLWASVSSCVKVAEPVWTFDWRREGKGLAGLTHARHMTNICLTEVGCSSCLLVVSWLGSCPQPSESMGGEISTLMAPSTGQFWPPCPLLLERRMSEQRTAQSLGLPELWLVGRNTPCAQGEVRQRHFPSQLTKLPTPTLPLCSLPGEPQRVGFESPQGRGFKGRAGLFKARGNPSRGNHCLLFSQQKRL